MKIHEIIKKARKEQGYTQFHLAFEVGVHQKTICHLETGKRAGNYKLIQKILKALECELAIVQKGEGAEFPKTHIIDRE